MWRRCIDKHPGFCDTRDADIAQRVKELVMFFHTVQRVDRELEPLMELVSPMATEPAVGERAVAGLWMFLSFRKGQPGPCAMWSPCTWVATELPLAGPLQGRAGPPEHCA